MKGVGWGFWPTFITHAVYEYKDHINHPDVAYNSPVNSAGDQAIAMVGWYMARDGDTKMLLFYLISLGAAIFTKEALGIDIG